MNRFGSVEEQDSRPLICHYFKIWDCFCSSRNQSTKCNKQLGKYHSTVRQLLCVLPIAHCLWVGPETRVNTGIWNYLFRI